MDSYQVVIIGQGPAGLSAAIYTGRAGLSTAVIGCDPKVAGDYDIDNYFGFPETVTGRELIDRGVRQAVRFGAEISCEKTLAVHFGEDGGWLVKTDRRELAACAVVLATGVSRKKPDIAGLEPLEGRGVSYCVSCDGFFFRGKKVAVAGEGVFAANQALELLQYTPHVTVCTLGKAPAITHPFMERLEANGVKIVRGNIKSLEGDGALRAAVMEDGSRMDLDGLFIALGEASSLDFARSLGVVTEGIFIKIDVQGRTNVPGIFAAGDCTGGFLQISVAVGEGALAARSAIDHVKSICPAGGAK